MWSKIQLLEMWTKEAGDAGFVDRVRLKMQKENGDWFVFLVRLGPRGRSTGGTCLAEATWPYFKLAFVYLERIQPNWPIWGVCLLVCKCLCVRVGQKATLGSWVYGCSALCVHAV